MRYVRARQRHADELLLAVHKEDGEEEMRDKDGRFIRSKLEFNSVKVEQSEAYIGHMKKMSLRFIFAYDNRDSRETVVAERETVLTQSFMAELKTLVEKHEKKMNEFAKAESGAHRKIVELEMDFYEGEAK